MMTRVEVVRGLIEKHANFMLKYQSELETGVTVDPAIIEAMEEARVKRDALNVSVASIKERRTSLKEENRQLRKKFLEMLRIQEQLKGKAKDISEISEFIDRQEYKLMTEGVNLEAERKLMKDIKESMNNIRQLTGGYVPKEVEDELTSLDSKINVNFITIEEEHQKMLGIVSDSQVHHQKFVDEAKKVREVEARKGWLQRRIAIHNEMMKFWDPQTANAEAMDSSDKGRISADIRDRLLKEMEEAMKADEQARKPRRDEPPKEEGGHAHTGADAGPSPSEGEVGKEERDVPKSDIEGNQGGST